MNSEEHNIIAFVFKRSGKTEINFSDFYLILSVDLKWFTPEAAKAFTDQMVKQKLLKKKEGELAPTFEINKIEVPLGFRPSKQILKDGATEPKEEKVIEGKILQKIVEKIMKKSKLDNTSVLRKIEETSLEKNVTKEVAALLLGKKYGIDLDDFYDEIEKKIVLGS
jgi:hypothetical protein